jgi:type I restriction enzyme S subunit
VGAPLKIKTIPVKWLENEGRRLDCGPYMSGAIEAKELLRKLPIKKESLKSMMCGIYHAGRKNRLWVDSNEYGVPFMGSTDILVSDLSNLPLISKKQVQANPNFTIRKGWTLITRSGTIGRMAYARPDMDGFACSEDVIRVVPDKKKVQPGYIYSYLSSKFGVPLVVAGTYGAIIQHIEPQHIADLPVPRLGDVEERAHELIQYAANAHVQSTELREKASNLLNSICGFPAKLAPRARNLAFSTTSSSDVLRRLDATFHTPVVQKAIELINAVNGICLNDAGVKGYESNRMKQIFVESGYGTPFITSGGIFSKTIAPERYLQNQLLGYEECWRINEYDTLIARSGQIGGIIGRGVWADCRLDGFAASPHILRLRSINSEFPPGYLYTYLCLTDVGYTLLVRTAAGSSIPFLPLNSILEIKIPQTPTADQRNKIDDLIKRSGELREQSQQLEAEAVDLVERAIEEGGR